MSGVLKPMIVDTTSTTPDLQIHVDQVMNVDKLDLPASPGRQAKYQLLFRMKNNTTQKLTYATAALRNTAYTNFNTALSTAI